MPEDSPISHVKVTSVAGVAEVWCSEEGEAEDFSMGAQASCLTTQEAKTPFPKDSRRGFSRTILNKATQVSGQGLLVHWAEMGPCSHGTGGTGGEKRQKDEDT